MIKKIFFLLLFSLNTIAVPGDPVTLDLQAERSQRATERMIRMMKIISDYSVENIIRNGDEELFDVDRRGNFGKSLDWNSSTFHKTEYDKLLTALNSADSSDFDLLVGGAAPDPQTFKIVNPQASFSYDFLGGDQWNFSTSPVPTLKSAELAGEMVELYWMSLIRDLYFNQYSDTSFPALAQEKAISEINGLSDFNGPKDGGAVTDATLFRGTSSGELVGPYISQFLYQPIPQGVPINYDGSGSAVPFDQSAYQEMIMPAFGSSNNFMTDETEWENIQRGRAAAGTLTLDESRRFFIRNGRDLAHFIQHKKLEVIGLDTAKILLGYGNSVLDSGMSYPAINQEGFITFGPVFVMSTVSKVIELACKTAWFSKWYVHRRLRPEACAYLVEKEGIIGTPTVFHDDLLLSDVLTESEFSVNKLLSSAYPEGAPCHPSYPSAHAVVGGAVATILKALFDETFIIPNSVRLDCPCTDLEAYTGTSLTVGSELNKLASNIGIGRCFAGVNFRSDVSEGLFLGEKVAIKFLTDLKHMLHETPSAFSLTKFDGTSVTI